MKMQTISRAVCASAVILAANTALAQTLMVLSDGFDRATTPANTPVGTPPSRDTTASAGWVSDWGANNNYAGGYVNQTYTTYNDGTQVFKVDGMAGISGNWLNNGSPAHPLKLNNSGTTITEPIGLPGFGWVQLNHNFAADANVAASTKMTVEFDFYRTPGGNLSWYLGNSQPTGVNNGNAGSPALNVENDVSIYWRGFQASSYGLRDNGLLPAPVPGIASYDAVAYTGGPNLNAQPISIKLDITGTNFTSGQTSTLEMTVTGVQQDLNGSNEGLGYTFTWDAGTAAYMGFGSNSTPVEGTIAAPVYRASGFDNLRVSVAVPATPTWNIDDNGNWTTGSNWSTGTAPNASGAKAVLGAIITQPRTVTLDAPITVGDLTFDNTNRYTIAGGNTLSIQSAGQASITLTSGSHTIEAPLAIRSDTALRGAGTLKVASIALDAGTQLDLADRSLVVDYASGSPRAALEALIASGFAGGSQNGDGIITTAATPARRLGIAEAGETTFGGAFGGHTLDATSLVIRYTVAGDADLSGGVNLDDFTRLAGGFGAAGRWSVGDFNYDGNVNLDDFTILAANFGSALPADAARSSVPEPSTVSLLVAVLAAMGRRRRN